MSEQELALTIENTELKLALGDLQVQCWRHERGALIEMRTKLLAQRDAAKPEQAQQPIEE